MSLPKSGSSLVTSILKTPLNLAVACFSWGYYDVVPGWTRWLNHGGVVTHDHLWPSSMSLERLIENGVDKIFVHYRDPRAVAVSRAMHSNRFNDSFIFERYVGHTLPWILGWLEISDQYPNRVCVSSYENLLSDPISYFDQLLTWFSVRSKYMDKIRDHIDIHMANKAGNNFRQGTVDGWRKEISAELRERLWTYTPEPLARRLEMEM